MSGVGIAVGFGVGWRVGFHVRGTEVKRGIPTTKYSPIASDRGALA